jgi:hypothetical protein
MADPVITADQVQQILTSVADLTTELADTRARLLQVETDLLQAQAQANAAAQQAAAAQLPATQPAVQPPVAPAQTAFAQTPATATANIINYESTAGIKLYKMAGEKLKADFNLEASKFPQFTDNLHSRAVEQGWTTTILTVAGMYILRNYGAISRDAILSMVLAYALCPERNVQNSVNLFNCLEATLTPDALNTMYAD